jgi:hypothetical protein
MRGSWFLEGYISTCLYAQCRKAKSRKVAKGRTKSRNVACNCGDFQVHVRPLGLESRSHVIDFDAHNTAIQVTLKPGVPPVLTIEGGGPSLQ